VYGDALHRAELLMGSSQETLALLDDGSSKSIQVKQTATRHCQLQGSFASPNYRTAHAGYRNAAHRAGLESVMLMDARRAL
jgi:hypothetical protein